MLWWYLFKLDSKEKKTNNNNNNHNNNNNIARTFKVRSCRTKASDDISFKYSFNRFIGHLSLF